MTVRREIAQSPGEVCGSTDTSSHACGRRRDDEPAVSWRAEPLAAETYVNQYVEATGGASPPARRHAATPACQLVAAVNPRLEQKRS